VLAETRLEAAALLGVDETALEIGVETDQGRLEFVAAVDGGARPFAARVLREAQARERRPRIEFAAQIVPCAERRQPRRRRSGLQ
jgi:hypothetical protein